MSKEKIDKIESKQKEKRTKSQKKLLQYLEDLRRNEPFLVELKKLKNALKSKKEEKRELVSCLNTELYIKDRTVIIKTNL